MATAQSIIEKACRSIYVPGEGSSLTANELADCLEALNDLLDSWSADSKIVPYRTRNAGLAISASQESYTIGSGADFNIARPVELEAATLRSGDERYPVEVLDLQHFESEGSYTGGIPGFCYYEPTFPNGTLYFSGKPTTGYTLDLVTLQPFTSFSLLSTDIDFPPGYSRAIRYNLAIDLAPEFGVDKIPEAVVLRAAEGIDFIETQTIRQRKHHAELDAGLRSVHSGRYNVIRDH